MTRDEFDARLKHHVTPQPVVNFTLQMDMSNAKRYVPVEGEIARTYRPLRQEV